MSNLPKLDKLLKKQALVAEDTGMRNLLGYAENIVAIENAIAVVSDLKNGKSRIFAGRLGKVLGIDDYANENSIWEKKILSLLTEEDREEKYLAELRFFNYLRHVPRKSRADYYLLSKLRMKTLGGEYIGIIHRMYYIYAPDSDSITHALCLYGRQVFDMAGKSLVINSLTGLSEELTSAGDSSILSKREVQVLKLIDSGKTSADIAALLSISKNTVSRHRQEILAKLQVKNSLEAFRLAKTMRII